MLNDLTISKESIVNGALTYDTILICLSATEKLINKYAYLSKKYQNAGESYFGSNKAELNKYIQYRTLLSKAIYPKYEISDIQTLIKGEYSAGKCSVKLIDDIAALIKSGSYLLS